MIKRLKRKYTLVVMLAVISVLGVIITAINLVSYSSVNSQLDDKLLMIIDNEGKMPEFPPPNIPSVDEILNPDGDGDEESDADDPTDEDTGDNIGTDTDSEDSDTDSDKTDEDEKEPDEEVDKEEYVFDSMSPETPFETRFFVVKFDTDGTITSTDTSKVVSVDDALAQHYARVVLLEDDEAGYLSTYRFMKSESDDGTICVFIDANREIESVRSFVVASIIISIIGIIMVFVIVVLLSEVALKPIIESYEKQKRFITDAGHEMKTPLTVISANTEIIEMESGESQWTEGIKNQVSKLAALTEKLVILSKMEEGVKLEMNEFSLSDAMFDTCDQYRSIAMSSGVELDLSITESVTMVGNEGEIRRCVALLLDNAFRYVNKGGKVEVKVQKLNRGVELKFLNTTDGVEKGSLDRWFDRFYRTDLSRNSSTGGSGIGLSVVKAIVHAHGGNVKAFSPDGEIVEFTINI